MTYTQNHHLPQWEKTDKIKMSDFNTAMTTIDTGLAANENRTFDSLFRLARNHYNLLLDEGKLSKWPGAFRQTFPGSAAGGYRKADRLWIAGASDAAPTQASLKNLQQVTSTGNSNIPAAYTFTTTCMGRLRSIDVAINYNANAQGATYTPTVRLINQRTGETEATGSTSFTLSYSGGTEKRTLAMDIPFHAGESYRLELERTDQSGSRINSITADFTTTCMTFDKITNVPASASAVWNVREEAEAQGALVLVHYDLLGTKDAAVSLEFNGETFAPRAVRSATSQGRALTQAEFRVDRVIPASCDLTLHAECKSGAEMELFDWGGMLI